MRWSAKIENLANILTLLVSLGRYAKKVFTLIPTAEEKLRLQKLLEEMEKEKSVTKSLLELLTDMNISQKTSLRLFEKLVFENIEHYVGPVSESLSHYIDFETSIKITIHGCLLTRYLGLAHSRQQHNFRKSTILSESVFGFQKIEIRK